MVQAVIDAPAHKVQKDDSIAKLIGHFGRWQFVVLSAVILVKLSSGWVQMAILFLTPKLVYRCVEFSTNRTQYEVQNSTCYDDCNKYAYDTSPFENTIVSEWNLICDKKWLASFTQTVLQFGVLIGSILFGFLSDRYGRKNTFLLAVAVLVAVGFGVPFSPNYVVFTILRFFLGVAVAGTMVVSFVVVMETTGPRYREIVGCLFHIPFILGHVTVPLFAYYFRSWNTYTLALAVPPVLYLGYFFLMTESPRWLVTMGRLEEATTIVKGIAIMNKLPTSKVEETLKNLSNEISSKTDQPKANYLDLFRDILWQRMLCLLTIWSINGLTFFGLNQYISQTSPDPFISVAAAGLIQIPSNLIAMYTMKRFGRKITTSLFACLGGACALALSLVPDVFWITLTLGTLGVCFTAMVPPTIYIYSSELFPTVVRNMSIGALSVGMRVGSMVAPFVANLSVVAVWLPAVIFGCAPIISGLVCLWLPETKGTVLPDRIEDIKRD